MCIFYLFSFLCCTPHPISVLPSFFFFLHYDYYCSEKRISFPCLLFVLFSFVLPWDFPTLRHSVHPIYSLWPKTDLRHLWGLPWTASEVELLLQPPPTLTKLSLTFYYSTLPGRASQWLYLDTIYSTRMIWEQWTRGFTIVLSFIPLPALKSRYKYSFELLIHPLLPKGQRCLLQTTLVWLQNLCSSKGPSL